MKTQEGQHVHAQVEQVREKLQDLNENLRVVDGKVESLAPQRSRFELLDQACGSLEKLDELGAASLFWGEAVESAQIAERLRKARSLVSEFREQSGVLDEQRQEILDKIGLQEENLEILGEEIYHIREEEERSKLEWIVEREISPVPPRVQRMAWSRGGEEDQRFHKTLSATLLAGAILGLLLPWIPLPLPKLFQPEQMPRRLAQLVRQEQAKMIPPPPPAPETPQEAQEKEEPDPIEEPQPTEQPDSPVVAEAAPQEPPSEQPGTPGPAGSRHTVQKAGILAFRDEFASLAKDDIEPRLGAAARYGDADENSRVSSPTRSMLTTNAPGSSGGINIGSLSRNVGGNGSGNGNGNGGGIQGVPVGRATSTIAGIGGGGRPLAGGGPRLSRTDEEIQIVFDRYKSSFYRLYNRELRNDPTLRGQMVLRLTIEPDGSVSMCKLQSTDMDAPALATQVVDRVKTINFGAKDGVKTVTIVYPIDFLPAA